MEARKIIRDHGHSIDFQSTYENGNTQVNTCSKEDWAVWLLKKSLVDNGADEEVVEELYSAGYSAGYNECECDKEWD